MSLRERDESAHPEKHHHSPSQPLTRRQSREAENSRAVVSSRSAKPSRTKARSARPARAARPATVRRSLSSTKPVASRPQGQQSVPRRIFSFGALLFVAALVIGLSVPANAFLTDPLTVATTVEAPTTLRGQSMEVSSDAAAALPARDGYEVKTYAQQLQEKYANVSYTFSATSGAVRWPFPYAVTITDGFGPRPVNVSGTAFHNGVDFTPGEGTPIYAIADGVVTTHSEDQGGFGNHVILQHDIGGQNIESLYGHMQYGSSPLVVGDQVRVGDFIGLVGNTGTSYGAHLHFELHVDKVPVDPFVWLTNNAVN
jgi:murein DD-endopeptidase MepM/ murein hydrolase activator NlpD